ncbi:hypothetical protein JK361_26130 [Streptomyces sp. 5-8]|uniref:HTH psq-type domain-containing protein n=1 Tax=Streptomyces musisoli TaxID=2802280 RepID=A0ABS1P7H0_9ACTN|nr:hypothetical protein [Streptomyces musisoli]MBL1108025.1 hypothetical protein [Streptomyces musisoli]
MTTHDAPVTGAVPGRHRDWIPVTTLSVPTVFMGTSDGVICLDLVAVELAINGVRKGWTLSSDEAAYAADLLFKRGVDYSVIAERVGVSGQTLRKWFPTDETPLCDALSRVRTRSQAAQLNSAVRLGPVRCGTLPGYRRHQRRKEPQCDACRKARTAADRHYRLHGTYVGAPGVAA